MTDEVSLKRLVLVKRLYMEGVEKARHEHNYADQMLVVINLFLAVETLMGAVVLSIEQQPDSIIGAKGYIGQLPSDEQVSKFKLGDYHKFEHLFNQVVAILRNKAELDQDERLFNWGKLERLQKARNDAQHGAKAPHLSDLPELITTTQEFIDRVLGLHFSTLATTLPAISLAKLINDDVLRQYIEHAETALIQNQYKTCALLVRVAFLLGRLKRRFNWWKDREGHRVLDDYDVSHQISKNYGVRPLDGNDSRLLHHITTEVSKLPRLFENWILGLDEVDRARLVELTPRFVRYSENMIGLPPSDEVTIISRLDRIISGEDKWEGPHFQHLPSKEDCLWLLDYTIEVLLRWQREQRRGYLPVDPKYLDALPTLEQIK